MAYDKWGNGYTNRTIDTFEPNIRNDSRKTRVRTLPRSLTAARSQKLSEPQERNVCTTKVVESHPKRHSKNVDRSSPQIIMMRCPPLDQVRGNKGRAFTEMKAEKDSFSSSDKRLGDLQKEINKLEKEIESEYSLYGKLLSGKVELQMNFEDQDILYEVYMDSVEKKISQLNGEMNEYQKELEVAMQRSPYTEIRSVIAMDERVIELQKEMDALNKDIEDMHSLFEELLRDKIENEVEFRSNENFYIAKIKSVKDNLSKLNKQKDECLDECRNLKKKKDECPDECRNERRRESILNLGYDGYMRHRLGATQPHNTKKQSPTLKDRLIPLLV